MRQRAHTSTVLPVLPLLATGALALGALTACGASENASVNGSKDASTTVTVVTHDSFVLPDDLKAAFEKESGYTLKVLTNGDAGALTNKLVLTQADPLGDVAFGVDNTFASRALDADVFAEHTPAEVPAGVSDFNLDGDDGQRLTPVDNGNVCINVDTTWFAEHDLAAPVTLDDLTKPAYKDLLVLPGASTSSPGMAFLLTTIAAKGDDWPTYWEALLDNGAKLTAGWSDAYQVDFTAGGGDGTRPIVLSYDSSPAFTVADGKTSTAALLQTCFTQVEYAGVLTHAANPEGAAAFVDFLLTPEVQAALPESMYVFPVVEGTPLPADWAKFTERPSDPWTVAPDEIDANRDEWLTKWTDITTS